MHVEPPEGPLRTLKEFLSHYAMIVLSIVTALALEQVAVGMEHSREGARARAEIEQEIGENRAQVEESMKATFANLDAWRALMDSAAADLASGKGTPERRLALVHDAMHKYGDALPALKSSAWEAAVAAHTVDYLGHEDLARFSDIYTHQRFFGDGMWEVLRDGALRNLSTLTLAQARKDVDPNELLATLNWRVQTLSVIASDLAQLKRVLGKPTQ